MSRYVNFCAFLRIVKNRLTYEIVKAVMFVFGRASPIDCNPLYSKSSACIFSLTKCLLIGYVIHFDIVVRKLSNDRGTRFWVRLCIISTFMGAAENCLFLIREVTRFTMATSGNFLIETMCQQNTTRFCLYVDLRKEYSHL